MRSPSERRVLRPAAHGKTAVTGLPFAIFFKPFCGGPAFFFNYSVLYRQSRYAMARLAPFFFWTFAPGQIILAAWSGGVLLDGILPGIQAFFPFWDALTQAQRDDLLLHGKPRRFHKGEVVLPYRDACIGLLLVQSGRLRAFVLSDRGREVTLYRLHALDICLFSAACVMNNIQFDIQIQAEEETAALLVPASLYNGLTHQSLAMADYTNQLMASRFSDVMWTLEQVLFKSMDARLAHALLTYAADAKSRELALTHEAIARDLGSAREVVTRMLHYFRAEGLLSLGRGHIRLLDEQRLAAIAAG